MRKLAVIIPAAGAGTRMKSYGPKCLISVNGETLLARQVRMIKKTFAQHPDFDEVEITVVLGYRESYISRKVPSGVGIAVSEDFENTNVAHSIHEGMKANQADATLIVMGDLFFSATALRPFLRMSESSVLVDTFSNFKKDEVGITTHGEAVQHFCYGIHDKKWGQIAFLTGLEQHLFFEISKSPSSSRMFAFEVLNVVLKDERASLLALEPKKLVMAEFDTPKDLKEALTGGVVRC